MKLIRSLQVLCRSIRDLSTVFAVNALLALGPLSDWEQGTRVIHYAVPTTYLNTWC